MVLFNNIPYKRMYLTSKVNLTKHFSEKYKCMRLTTRLYSIYFMSGCHDYSYYSLQFDDNVKAVMSRSKVRIICTYTGLTMMIYCCRSYLK